MGEILFSRHKLEKASQHCISCHFLAQQAAPGSDLVTHILTEYRSRLKAGDFKWLGVCRIGCYFQVWDVNCYLEDERGKASSGNSSRQLSEVPRNDCFYMPYKPGVSFEGADRLLQKQESYSEASQDRKHTRYALYIAAAGVIASAIVGIASFYISCVKMP